MQKVVISSVIKKG